MIIHHQHRFLLLLFSIFLLTAKNEILFAQKRSDHVPGDLLVMLKHGADVQGIINEFAFVDGKKTGLIQVKNISKRMDIWKLHFNNDVIDENKMLGDITQYPDVIIAQFNHYAELRNTPDDTFFGQQWDMLNIGQVGGSTPGADVRATTAWDLTTGGLTASGDTIVIAIVDDGTDLNHEDLNFWKNYAEIPGNNIDDDNNGYIDDYDGWNAVNHNGALPVTNHGTEMAGIAGAIGNNAKGIAGMNWNVKLMPLKGVGTEDQTVEAYTYVLEMRKRFNDSNGAEGAFVVATNSSFGVNNGHPDDFPLWCAMYDSMGAYGIMNAAATTNSNADVDIVGDIPTTCPSDYLITVTNTTAADELFPAGYGLISIDLGAPGTNITTTIPNNSYTSTATGTSPATPHITGAIGLMYSLQCSKLIDDYKTDPAGTALRMKNFILGSVDTLSSLEGKTVTGGRLNVYNALQLEAAYYDCNVGIDEVSSANENIFAYPNPAVDVLNVVIKNFHSNSVMLSVKNVLGQTMTEKNISASTHAFSLDVSKFEKGIYFLSISNAKESNVLRWVKQ